MLILIIETLAWVRKANYVFSTGRSRLWHPLVVLRPLTSGIGPDLGKRPAVGLVSGPTPQFTPIATTPTELKSHPSSRASLKLHRFFAFTTTPRIITRSANRDGMSKTDVSTGLFHVPPGLCVSARRYQCHLARLSQPWHPANARTFLAFISFFKDFACRDKSCVKWPSAKAGPHYLLSWCWGRLWHKFTWDRCSYFWGHFWGKFTSDRCTATFEGIYKINLHEIAAATFEGIAIKLMPTRNAWHYK